MIAYLRLVLHVVVSPFKTRAQLEAEIVLLRRRRIPSKPKLATVDRLFFVWLYRLFPSVLRAVAIVQPETIHPVASSGLPAVLALEVTLARGPAKGSAGDPATDPRDELGQPVVGRAAHSW